MKKNIGCKDPFPRLDLAYTLVRCSIWKSSWFFLLLFVVFTSLKAPFSRCIAYQVLEKNSCPIQRKKILFLCATI
ncbi:MAG: hypothetical protein LBC45_04140 [Chlamydiales bacterium]|nr:hypothetical protein [Chlamydiales bacterium]